MRSNLLVACILMVTNTASLSQDVLTRENVGAWDPLWRFHRGDDASWSAADLDETGWDSLEATLFDPGMVDTTQWNGYGWFRTRFTVDSSAAGTTFAYTISLGGGAEIYLDGNFVARFGRPSQRHADEIAVRHTEMNPGRGLLPPMDAGSHVLAVRASNFILSAAGDTDFGFNLRLDDPLSLAHNIAQRASLHAAKTFSLSGIALVLALIFLGLFAYHRKLQQVLLFGILSLLSAFVLFTDLQSQFISDPQSYVLWRRYMELAAVAGWLVAVRFVRVAFFKDPWRMYYVLATLGGFVALYVYFDPIGGFWSLVILSVLASIEFLRRVGLAAFLSRPGAWIVALGAAIFMVFAVHDYLHAFGWISEVASLGELVHVGLVIFLALMAFFVTTDLVRSTGALEIKLMQREQDAAKAIQEEKINQNHRIERIQAEFDSRRKEVEQNKEREVDAVRRGLTVAEGQLKEMRAKLVRSEGMSALGRLSSGIAKDLRELLAGIGDVAALSKDLTSEIQQAVDRGADKDQSKDLLRQLGKNLERIEQQGTSALRVVQDVVEHSASDTTGVTLVDVNSLVDRYLNLMVHSNRGGDDPIEITIERVFDDRVGELETSGTALGRALMSVFRNAVEAIRAHAETQEDFEPTISVSTQRLANAVLIRVRDNGPGIPQDIRDRVFEPFYSTKGDHAGLGLSIANDTIVDELGGTFGLEHFKEQGAGFYITIPLSAPKGDEEKEDASVSATS